MSLIKRFASRDRERVEGGSGNPDLVSRESEVSEITTAEGVSALMNEADSPQVIPLAGPTESAPSEPVTVSGGAIKQMKAAAMRQKASHRAALDFLNILKSLAPVFKAVTIYPGHDAPAEQIAAAVRRLSEASVDLAEFVAASGDTLEIDSAWAKKTLHEFTADLVSNYWVSSVIAKGGSEGMPEVSADFFKPAIRAVLALPVEEMRPDGGLKLSFQGAIQLSLLKGLTPIEIEIERFATFLGLHVPGSKVSTSELLAEISQFLMEQSLIYHERFLQENPESSEDDRRVMLQALIGHASTVLLSAWEYCKGEVYAGVSDSKSAQAALEFLTQEQFTHGFPLTLLKARTEESLRRLVGSASYALVMLRRQNDEPRA